VVLSFLCTRGCSSVAVLLGVFQNGCSPGQEGNPPECCRSVSRVETTIEGKWFPWGGMLAKTHSYPGSSTISSISSRRLSRALNRPVRAGREAETSRLVIIEERIIGSGEDVRRAEFGPDVKNDLVARPLIVVP